jgi:hypothetical protein
MSERRYPSGTKEALCMLSRGHCYAPDCGSRVMRCVEGQWRIIAHVAHICGLNDTAARFDASLSVEERNGFGNLLLLCKPHHDVVDSKKLERRFPKGLLTRWKQEREGDYANDLLELGMVSDAMLRGWMTDAVADTRDEIAQAFDRLSDVNREFLASLKQAAMDFFDLPYLDPEDIQSLHYSATVFERIPDYADLLVYPAQQLRELPDATELLMSIARDLKELPDTAELLLSAAVAIRKAGLPNFVTHAADIRSTLDEVLIATSDMSDAMGEMRGLPNPARLEPAGYAVRLLGDWSWRPFWWGIGACGVFVVAVLALWSYVLVRR